ncbi:MAG: hypothetical protein FD177_208 [Desulfovibrionaceae bacterium]|nr:MAG: hypothetical protein FD177_208 [Desulfovibrionaceae bacterium]
MAASIQFRMTTDRLGGAATSTQLSTTAIHNLFDIITPAEAVAGDIEYRALDVYNSGDATATFVAYYNTPSSSTYTEIEAGIEAAPTGSTTAIADESAAPAGVTFAIRSSAAKLTLPDIAAGAYVRLWFKRIVTSGAPNMSNDLITMYVDFA